MRRPNRVTGKERLAQDALRLQRQMREEERLEKGPIGEATAAIQSFFFRSLRSLVLLLLLGVVVYQSHDWAAKEYANECLGVSSIASMYCRGILAVINYSAGTFPEMLWKVLADLTGNLHQYIIMYLD